MKKKLLLLLGVCGLVIPSLVKADMGAPEIRSYEVVVSNVNGAKAIGDDKIIPYETKCTVNYEDEYEGFLQLEVTCGDDENNYTLDAKDVRILKEEYLPEKDYKLDKLRKYYIFKDLDMYRGPSFKYDKVDKFIPAGTIIDVSYVDYDDEVWGYTEYDGQKGWVYIYWYDKTNRISTVLSEEKDKNLITINKITKLYKYPTDEKATVDINIPINTTLKSDYYYQTWFDTGLYYITYKGISGWIDMLDGVSVYNPGSILVLNTKKVQVYDSNFKNTSLNIKKYQEFAYDYKFSKYIEDKESTQGIYRINYNGKHYYIDSYIQESDEASDFKNAGLLEAYPCKVEVKKSATIYDSYDMKNVVGTIKSGEKFDRNYNLYMENIESEVFYIKTSTISGWINGDAIEKLYDEKSENSIKDEQQTTKNTNTATNDKKNMANSNRTMSTKEIVMMCIAGAVILALVVIVLIVLINRKKDKNKDNAN